MLKFEKYNNSIHKKNIELSRVKAKLKKMNKRTLDETIHSLHYEYENKIDCLSCANCCKSLGPRLNNSDIERLSKFLKIKSSDFINTYLRIDEDNDYVFKSMPCPFLDENNYCIVYESRPKACKEYPHTDRVNFYQIIDLSIKNAEICPIVFEIFSDIQSKLK